jgi:uncharacterized protein YdeI (YjbR/CyaY-like superfamily)
MPDRPSRNEVSVFPDAAAFRAWLEQHHDDTDHLWVGYYRKATGKTSISYPEAVDEALCFGWIDGITFRVDDEVHTNRFTPRQRLSGWSEKNVRRAKELIDEGRMMPAGRRAFDERRMADEGRLYTYENRPRDLPDPYEQQVRANPAAWAVWTAQTPSFRRTATWWVVGMKQEATRQRHLDQLIDGLASGDFPQAIRPIGGEDR